MISTGDDKDTERTADCVEQMERKRWLKQRRDERQEPSSERVAREQVEGASKLDLPRSWTVLGLVLMLIIQLGLTILWLHIDTRPPIWDRANHAERAFRCSEILASPSPGLLDRVASLSGFYPPLIHCIVGATYLLVPVSEFTHQAVLYLFLAISLAAIYCLGFSLHGAALGLAAAGITVAAPLIQVESRAFMLDIPLMMFVTLSYLAALKSNGFTRLGPSLILGVVTGLGLLTKWSLVVYTMPAFITALGPGGKRLKDTRPLALAGLSAAVAGAIAGPWYFRNIGGIISALGARAIKMGQIEGDPPVLSAASALYYLASLLPQVGVVPAALFFVGLAALLTRGPGGLVLAAHWVAPWLLVTLVRNKDLRYTLPLIPAVALVASYGLLRFRPPGRYAVTGLLVVWSVWQVLASGFGIFSVTPQRFFQDLPLLVTDPPRREH